MCPRTHKTSLNKGKYRYDAHVRVEKSLQLEDNDLSYVHPLMCWGLGGTAPAPYCVPSLIDTANIASPHTHAAWNHELWS